MKHLNKWAFLLACTLAVSCSSGGSDDPDVPDTPNKPETPSQPETPNNPTSEDLAKYVCPTYNDNYTSVAAWTQRSKWNLANVHDPSVVKAADGYYYMYQTDASYGNVHNSDVRNSNKHGHFFCRRSKNLVDWEFVGASMVGLPSWIKPKLNEIRKQMGVPERDDTYFANDLDFGYWAPCVRKVNDNLYRMYYCITCPGTINGNGTWSERAFIGLMETSDPASNKWEDKGFVITNASDKGLNFRVSQTDYNNCYFKFNAIDPTYIITPEGKHWLIYGSWHSGFAAVELDASTGKTKVELPKPFGTAEEIAPYGKLIFTRTLNNRWQGAEAPEVVYHDGYYYLFLAYDGLDVPYNTRVLRSKNVDGPYETMNNRVTNAANGAGDNPTVLTHPYKFSQGYGWVGISHCAVFDDGAGNWYYVSQQRFPKNVGGNAYSNALMMGGVRSIKWNENGWPVVMPERYGAVPQVTIKASELAGTWEGIDLAYEYGKQRVSTEFTLNADGSMTGGTAWPNVKVWNFDTSSNTLTIGTTKLKVQREVDWEASPRKLTIVYSGVSGSKSFWGKKNKY
jgi:Beta-xylosidase